jgi:hypothetical protein
MNMAPESNTSERTPDRACMGMLKALHPARHPGSCCGERAPNVVPRSGKQLLCEPLVLLIAYRVIRRSAHFHALLTHQSRLSRSSFTRYAPEAPVMLANGTEGYTIFTDDRLDTA